MQTDATAVPAGLFVLLGLGFSVLAGLAAFLITYDEWSHHYTDTREPLKQATKAAVVAFSVFVILAVLADAFVGHLLSGQ